MNRLKRICFMTIVVMKFFYKIIEGSFQMAVSVSAVLTSNHIKTIGL